MNTSGCPACCWLLCLQYICVVLNHLASPTLQGICPIQALQGTTPDVSLIQFLPKLDEDWLRYELLNSGQIYETKLAEDVVLCVHNTTSALNS